MTTPPPRLALTRAISASLNRCALTHLERTPIDIARARAEHAAYESALRAIGYEVRQLPAAPELPDSVFIEDTAIVLDEIAVLARPGAPARRLEVAAVAAALSSHRRLEAIEAPGTLDGGDVLKVGSQLFIGRSSRTNDAGIEQMREIVSPLGLEVIAVDVLGCLHLKSAVTELAEGTILMNRRALEPTPFAGLRSIDVDPTEPNAANVLRTAGIVIMPSEYPKTRARIEAEGIRVVTVPQEELAKAEGGVTCGSLLIHGTRRAR